MKKLFPVLYTFLLLAGCSGGVYPPTKIAKVNGTELAYAEAGQGVPVIFVHGASSDTRVWETQRNAIAGHYRFIAYSLRYHEPNRWQDDGKLYGVQTHAEDLAAFIKLLNVGPVHLVGHSYGGAIVAQVALDHPELVKTITLEEAGIGSLLAESPDGKTLTEEFSKVVATAKDTVKSGDSIEALRNFVDYILGEKGGFVTLPPSIIDMFKANAKTLGPQLGALPPPTINCAKAGTIKAPTLILNGEHTIVRYKVINSVLKRCIPNNESIAIPEADHMVQLRNPNAFNEALLAFLVKRP